ncbi:hypothetical protein OHV05_37935 (plasmid) [Kitasatospora sp. NBC_00070]|uniref:hypothetical protein n=1 Tax=Kitasatospora sp. NBC_00070 TaxID=2975962 RepID=UPI002F918304
MPQIVQPPHETRSKHYLPGKAPEKFSEEEFDLWMTIWNSLGSRSGSFLAELKERISADKEYSDQELVTAYLASYGGKGVGLASKWDDIVSTLRSRLENNDQNAIIMIRYNLYPGGLRNPMRKLITRTEFNEERKKAIGDFTDGMLVAAYELSRGKEAAMALTWEETVEGVKSQLIKGNIVKAAVETILGTGYKEKTYETAEGHKKRRDEFRQKSALKAAVPPAAEAAAQGRTKPASAVEISIFSSEFTNWWQMKKGGEVKYIWSKMRPSEGSEWSLKKPKVEFSCPAIDGCPLSNHYIPEEMQSCRERKHDLHTACKASSLCPCDAGSSTPKESILPTSPERAKEATPAPAPERTAVAKASGQVAAAVPQKQQTPRPVRRPPATKPSVPAKLARVSAPAQKSTSMRETLEEMQTTKSYEHITGWSSEGLSGEGNWRNLSHWCGWAAMANMDGNNLAVVTGVADLMDGLTDHGKGLVMADKWRGEAYGLLRKSLGSAQSSFSGEEARRLGVGSYRYVCLPPGPSEPNGPTKNVLYLLRDQTGDVGRQLGRLASTNLAQGLLTVSRGRYFGNAWKTHTFMVEQPGEAKEAEISRLLAALTGSTPKTPR